MEAVEKRTRLGQLGGVRMELCEIDPNMLEGFVSQRDDTTFISLPGQGEVRQRDPFQDCENECDA